MRKISSILATIALFYGASSWAEVLLKINIADPDAVEIYSVASAVAAVSNSDYPTVDGILLLDVLKNTEGNLNDFAFPGSLRALGNNLPSYDRVYLSGDFPGGLNLYHDDSQADSQEFVAGKRAFFGKGIAEPGFLDSVTLKGVGTTGNIVAGYVGGDISAVLGQWEIVSENSVDGRITLEEPIDAKVHGGIGNLRGFAFFDEEIESVQVYLDGFYAFDAPYGGSRTDVGAAFPDFPSANDSGFSLAYGYSNLSPGEHTILVRAIGENGVLGEDTATFSVVGFKEIFIAANAVVSGSDTPISMDGDEIVIDSLQVGDSTYTVTMKWRTAEQGFEIVEIVEHIL